MKGKKVSSDATRHEEFVRLESLVCCDISPDIKRSRSSLDRCPHDDTSTWRLEVVKVTMERGVGQEGCGRFKGSLQEGRTLASDTGSVEWFVTALVCLRLEKQCHVSAHDHEHGLFKNQVLTM